MHTYKEAIDLQEWALVQSGTKQFLESLQRLPLGGKVKPRLYVDFEIDEGELDDWIDWPDVGVATVYAVLDNNGEEIFLGEVRAYNWETYWLSTTKYNEIDSAEKWKEVILKDYKNIKNKNGNDKEHRN
ncbi:MAG: hypothetical protein AABW75_02960 [Nanoarchaeota archaeon]